MEYLSKMQLTLLILVVSSISAKYVDVDVNFGSTHFLQSLQQKLKRIPKDLECPYPYQRSGELCLYAASCAQGAFSADWNGARSFCQTNAGINGDLVVFENACQFANILTYLNTERPLGGSGTYCGFWAGATDVNSQTVYKFIDGSVLPPIGIYWASTQTVGDYAYFDDTKGYYLNQGTPSAPTTKPAPLCQYVPKNQVDTSSGESSS